MVHKSTHPCTEIVNVVLRKADCREMSWPARTSARQVRQAQIVRGWSGSHLEYISCKEASWSQFCDATAKKGCLFWVVSKMFDCRCIWSHIHIEVTSGCCEWNFALESS